MNRITAEKERRIVEMYRAGKTYREIDAEVVADHAMFARVVRKYRLPYRGKNKQVAEPNVRECRHCTRVRWIAGRGLCTQCYQDGAIRREYRLLVEERCEPTEEELDRMIAEQMQCLPKWWDSESKLAEVGCQAGSRKKRGT